MDELQAQQSDDTVAKQEKIIRGFLAAVGNNDPDAQAQLEKEMGFGYRSGVGKATFAMVTTRPDAAHAVTRLSQHSVCPHKLHYAGIRHLLKYLFATRTDGIFYWGARPNMEVPETPAHGHK